MDEVDMLMKTNTVFDDSDTLYINRDYISIDNVVFRRKLRCTYSQIFKSLNETHALEHIDGSLYWKLSYNGDTHIFKYIPRTPFWCRSKDPPALFGGKAQRSKKEYFEFYSTQDSDEFIYKYIDMFL